MTIMKERPAVASEPVPENPLEAETPQEEFLRPRQWTTAEYYHMSDLGLFDDERVELLDGEIWTLPSQKTPHYYSVEAAAEVLLIAFGPSFTARKHGPITLEDGTEPEPDVAIVPGSRRDYLEAHPAPTEVCLLVEVSDATLRKDRAKKVNDYARVGIADYWIINLVNRQLEVYRDPAPMLSGYGYKTALILFEGDTIAPLSAPNGIVAVADLFPPPVAP